ncbi:28S ribosomal protein S17, mitochondrial [Bombyx mandarina]|uniref:28S ribosomal protein S17, mitochondrial n=1 Tax=Bombyx mandarina TaxID=7092 RepID=A0A6J2KTA4_BOMMA|nr:28S ribosomal protein S17, mitochondrial [Bombyx mandarina]XP_028044209.1 28S ribosomal protein S17, mitochondrial [Bombyx mandarina]
MSRNVADAARKFLLLGQCVPTVKQNAAKIRVKRLELDENLLMYFRKEEFYYCHDSEKICKTGDIVLIQALPEKLTKLITHEIKEVVYPFGDITDPVTGKKVSKEQYKEDIERQTELYGRLKSTFNYSKAPPRGWQDGKKDFTSKPTYTKFHVFDENDPYGI